MIEEFISKPLHEAIDEMFIGPFGSSLKNESFVDKKDGYCMVYEQKHAIQKTMDVETRYVTKDKFEELKRFNIKGGDIIVSCRGTIGETFIVPMQAPIGIMHPSIMKIRLKEGVYDKQYFNLLLIKYLKEHEAEANGSGVKMAISAKELSEVRFPIPPFEVQKNIVSVFELVDKIITLRKQQLAKLDELVKARFVELFGDPEDSTTKWDRANFASVCLDMHQGINTVADKVEYVNNGFPIIQSKNITSGYLDLEDVRYVKEKDYEYYRNKYNPKPSDLLVCNIGTIGKSMIVEDEVDFLIAWNLFLIKLNKKLVNPVFVKVFIELLNQQNYFEKYMTGETVKFVNKKTMGAISTPIPPLELQNQFATFVEQTDKSKSAIQQSLEKLETFKRALMQKYFG